MQSDVIDKTYILINKLKELPLYKEVIDLENRINKELDMELKEFNIAKEKYNEALKYGNYHPSLGEYERDLSEKKKILYNNELVKEYNKKYKELSNLLDEMFDTIKSNVSNKFTNDKKLRCNNSNTKI